MTQLVQPSSEIIIFITYVEADDTYLKIWGQLDKQAATCVERFIYPLVEQFAQGYGCPSKPNRSVIGALCCARFQNDGYYRAKVLNVHPDGMIVVQFIDYGNIEVLPPHEIHLLDSIHGAEPLLSYPAMAAEFTLVNVLPINGIWENRIIEAIKKSLCYNEYRALIQPIVNNRCLIKLWFNNEDFSEVLVKERMALPTTIQDMFRPKHLLHPQMSAYHQENKNSINNFTAMQMIQNTEINHINMQGLYHKNSPGINQHKHTAESLLVQEALVFKSRVLDVGSKHEVLISCVEDGPQKFSVQVQSTREILTCLMNEINSYQNRPLQEPPLPGSVCLGHTQEGVLCRAVVMSVMEHKCKLYYVDFGYTEILPYTDIFQLPPKYINPKVLSIRFTLSGLKELNVTQEMKDYFKELVTRKLLVLHVRPPEGPPLIQYGDLYENGINIKDILKKAFPVPTAAPMAYMYPQLRRLPKHFQEIVHVSFIESYKKFFVQLDSGIKSLESIMAGLAQYAKTALTIKTVQLKTGLPCAALYESQWYRAQILDVNGDEVRVVYVDYGNEEVLSIMSLRVIHQDLVTKLPAQAIQCTLNNYETLPTDQDIFNYFERLTLEKRLHMKIVAVQSNSVLVDLLELETMQNIHSQLLKNLFSDKVETSALGSQAGGIQYCMNVQDINNKQSEQADRYVKNNTDSWNRIQNAKSSHESKVNTSKNEWPQEKRNKRYERNTTNSQRNNSPNDRFTKDEIVNNKPGKDKLYNKFDKSEADTYKGSKGIPRSDKNRFCKVETRHNRNSSTDKTWSDKDSDNSSIGGKRGKGNFNHGDQAGKRENGILNKLQTVKWSDRDYNKSNNKNEKFNDGYNISSNKFNDEDTSTVLHDEINTDKSLDTNNSNKHKQLKNDITCDKKSQFSSISITLGDVRKCEVVFTNSPSSFFIQLSPDYMELKAVMEKIAAIYENNGELMQIPEIHHNTHCIAQYTTDFKWYRAIIKSIDKNYVNVQFVDYGNIESVDFTKIKIMQEEFLKLPMQAIHCKLLGFMSTGNNENECTLFMGKVEEKLLEVEFIAEDNGIYEVLIREIIDNIPNANYLNEEFCTGVDLSKAKKIAESKKMTTTIRKETQVIPDYASFDSKWETILYETGSNHDAIITWFINPNKFYCQITTKETEFKTMMNEIQSAYIEKECITHRLQVGSAIMAIFDEDGALYRAEIVANNPQKGYIIQYIDFGNYAIVNERNIYPVEKRFMQLPKLAVQCSLNNIIPRNDSSWSELDNDALDSCFNADKYECTFHNFNDGQYIISLSRNGEDVSDALVEKKLAAFAINASVEAVADTESLEINVEKHENMQRVDISLLSGQIIKMKVSSVKSTNQFHVQLPLACQCERIIDEYMTDKNIEVMPRLLTREMCLGAGCLVKAKGMWRRAVVINCSRYVGLDVKFIDTGMYDEIFDGVLALPEKLAVMQNQALECSLLSTLASLHANEQLKDLVEGKEILVYVEEVSNNRLIVKLYDLCGNSIMNTEENIEKVSPICPMPILNSTHEVSVSYADNFTNIWLQRHSDAMINAKLLKDLEQYYSNSGQRLKPEMHLLCAAKYTDDRWYRGKIIKYTETAAYVNFIDYGDTKEIKLDSLMVLEPQFYEPYQLAINTSLSVIPNGTESEQINIIQTHLLNKEFTAVFYNVHKKWIVDLTENGKKLYDELRSLNLVEEKSILLKEHSRTNEILVNCKYDVSISHVDSPSQFWLQRTDEISSLIEKQKELQLKASDFPPIDGVLEEGTLCIATYSIDNLWYRAEVLDADEDITTIRYIDYGNTDVIDNKEGNIRQMPKAWRNLERYAHKCRLDILPVDIEDWNEATCERFETLVASGDKVQALLLANTTPKRVDLFINDKSISEILVEENRAIIINTEQEVISEIIDLELDPHSAFVSHINSPNEFWVQEEKSVADLEVMADRFMVAHMFPKINDIKEDLLCVAKYPEDAQWYRARVMSHNDHGTEVIYVDYGNSAVCTEIRSIPEDLAHMPPLSRKCCLELPSQIKEWSEQACKEFIKLAADGATIFLLDILKEQETSLVKLTLKDKNVADILVSMCEHLPVIEERLPPLGEENSPNVVVSHINSPNEFWIQAESCISELEVMSDRLRTAASFLPLNTLEIGAICTAQYPEDGCWYRAKILTHHEEGIKVLYIDYGNSAITEELRVLPEDIVNIPILSKRCTLKKPSHIEWTEAACDKFKELAAEGATMFQFETLNEDDPLHVHLNLHGMDVVQLLLTECKNISEIGTATEIETEDITHDIKTQEIISETVFHDNFQSTEDTNKKNSDFSKETDQELLSCNIEPEQIENVINTETINESLDDCIVSKSKINIDNMTYDTISSIENKNDMEFNKESIIISDYTSKITEISNDNNIANITETNKDLGTTNDEINFSTTATTTCFTKCSSTVTELSIDEIIENMVKAATENLNSQTYISNESLNQNLNLMETQQFVSQEDTDEQQILKIQLIDINESLSTSILESLDVNVKVSSNVKEDLTENLNSKSVPLSKLLVTSEIEFQDDTQLDNTQEEKSTICEIQSKNTTESLELQLLPAVIDSASYPLKEQVTLEEVERKNSSIHENEIILKITDKDSNALVMSESTNKDNDLNVPSESTLIHTIGSQSGQIEIPSAVKTDPAQECSSLVSRNNLEE